MPPPFIIDAPGLEYGFDDRRRFFLTARPPHFLFDRLRHTEVVKFDRNQLRLIYGS
ncbi:MAG TPA: hypothetical protein VGJ80_11345 [Gemmatimonadales bacterium]